MFSTCGSKVMYCIFFYWERMRSNTPQIKTLAQHKASYVELSNKVKSNSDDICLGLYQSHLCTRTLPFITPNAAGVPKWAGFYHSPKCTVWPLYHSSICTVWPPILQEYRSGRASSPGGGRATPLMGTNMNSLLHGKFRTDCAALLFTKSLCCCWYF